jgi:pantoate--beta-alanine ligase
MDHLVAIAGMQDWARRHRAAGRRIAVVPTMGFLHEGHLSLIDLARREADVTVVTLFVNPTQFGPGEDLDRYPRNFDRDRELCELRQVDALFAPSAQEMYDSAASTWVEETVLSQGLCGRTRPGHFRGVVTVVAKLFNATLPDVAVFGEKDYQQAMVIRRMVQDLNFPVRILTAPLVREPDGLAMSSRNVRLSPEERERALSLSRSLFAAREAVLAGERDPAVVAAKVVADAERAGGRVDYVEVVDAVDLSPICEIRGRILVAVAAFFGKTRLIDNVVAEAPGNLKG